MFALFFSLYMAMFQGSWKMYTVFEIGNKIRNHLNGLGTFLTSIFGDDQMTTLGDVLVPSTNILDETFISVIAIILALITSIGIVVMAVKGIKRVFSIFFMPIR